MMGYNLVEANTKVSTVSYFVSQYRPTQNPVLCEAAVSLGDLDYTLSPVSVCGFSRTQLYFTQPDPSKCNGWQEHLRLLTPTFPVESTGCSLSDDILAFVVVATAAAVVERARGC